MRQDARRRLCAVTPGRYGVEAGLARCCWVLAGWETAYRAGRLTPTDDELYHGINPATVEAMRASASDCVVAELVALADRLDHAGLDQLRQLAGDPPTGQPLGLAAPGFVDSWADGDLLVGDCLVDVKTVISLREPARIVRWLWQRLGYAWLDRTDHYGYAGSGCTSPGTAGSSPGRWTPTPPPSPATRPQSSRSGESSSRSSTRRSRPSASSRPPTEPAPAAGRSLRAGRGQLAELEQRGPELVDAAARVRRIDLIPADDWLDVLAVRPQRLTARRARYGEQGSRLDVADEPAAGMSKPCGA